MINPTVHIFDDQSDLSIDPVQIKEIVIATLKAEQCTCHEVSVHFVDILTICKLHQQFFDDPSQTDCISLPIDSPIFLNSQKSYNEENDYCVLGEIFVCPATAIEYAKKFQLNSYEETLLYVIHGILHLIGYDDQEEDDLLQMREAEKRILKQLNLLRP